MTELTELIGYAFVQRAVLACFLLAVLASLVGFFVVQRRMAFVTVGLSHAALGGVAVGVLIGQSPTVWAIVVAVLVGLALARLGQRGVAEDTAMGIFFPAAMALGVVLISAAPTWQRDLMTYLFGSILAVGRSDLWALGVVTLGAVAFVGLAFRELLFLSFDEESAHAAGVRVEPLRAGLLVLCAVCVVVAIKVVGIVLVSAMLVIPAATAGQLTPRWQSQLVVTFLVALTALWGALVVSFVAPVSLNVPVGAAAVLIAAVLFGSATVVGRRRA